MINYYHRLILIFIAVFGFAACKQDRLPCGQPTTMSVILGCHQVIGVDTLNHPVITDTVLSSPVVKTFDSIGTPLTLFYPSATSKLTIHMSPVSDSCIWLVSPDTTSASTGGYDSLSFHYQRQLTFLSNACGYVYFYNLTSVQALSHHFIDSVQVINSTVNTNVNTEHVKIYFHKP